MVRKKSIILSQRYSFSNHQITLLRSLNRNFKLVKIKAVFQKYSVKEYCDKIPKMNNIPKSEDTH